MKKEPTLRVLWSVVALFGTLGALISLGILILAFVAPAIMGDNWLVVLVSLGLTGLLLGLSLAWAGITGRKDIPSPRYYSPWAWALLLGIGLVLMAVAIFIPADRHTHALFAPLHQGAILLPALATLFLVTWASGYEAAPYLRHILLAMTGGASSVLLALPVELVGFILSGLVAAMITAFLPNGEAELTRILDLAEQWSQNPTVDTNELLSLAASPVVLIAVTLALAVITPLIEEFGKTLVMGVMGFWEKPSLRQSFTWGVACGLGFAIIEGITNGAMGLGEVAGWVGGMGARLLATGMHALASGVLGLGWGMLWHKRWWALPLAYLSAVLYHGLWNFDVILAFAGVGIGETANSIGYGLTLLGVGIHLFLMLLIPIGLFGIPWWLRRREQRA